MRILTIGVLAASLTLTSLAGSASAQRGWRGGGGGRGNSVGVYTPYGGYQTGNYGSRVIIGSGYGYGGYGNNYGPGFGNNYGYGQSTLR